MFLLEIFVIANDKILFVHFGENFYQIPNSEQLHKFVYQSFFFSLVKMVSHEGEGEQLAQPPTQTAAKVLFIETTIKLQNAGVPYEYLPHCQKSNNKTCT